MKNKKKKCGQKSGEAVVWLTTIRFFFLFFKEKKTTLDIGNK